MRREIEIKGELGEEVKIPEFGQGVKITWTDGKRFVGTAFKYDLNAQGKQLRRAAKRVIDRSQRKTD